MLEDINIILRADASPKMGTGHVMRSLALAKAARARGMNVKLIGHITVPWLLERLNNEQIVFEGLHSQEFASVQHLNFNTTKYNPSRTWIILDGYHFSCTYQKMLQSKGYKVMVIDDYAHLKEYSCDILLNQNIGAELLSYSGSITHKLLGLHYVLLQPEFSMARKIALNRKISFPPQNVLISLGGGSFASFLKGIAEVLHKLDLPSLKVRVLKGSMRAEDIHAIFDGCSYDVEIIDFCNNMPSLLLDTGLCISAGGSTCWELCCLGVPFLTVPIAENQMKIVDWLEKQGIAEQFNADNLQDIFSSAIRMNRRVGMDDVDGHGANRVIQHLLRMSINLRPVNELDAQDIFTLVNEPDIRSCSLNSDLITLETHKAWFAARLHKLAAEPFYVVSLGDIFCGYVRFDLKPQGLFVSIALSKELRGKGLGAFILLSALSASGFDSSVYAQVHEYNIPSLSVFKKIGFVESVKDDNGFILLKYQGDKL